MVERVCGLLSSDVPYRNAATMYERLYETMIHNMSPKDSTTERTVVRVKHNRETLRGQHGEASIRIHSCITGKITSWRKPRVTARIQMVVRGRVSANRPAHMVISNYLVYRSIQVRDALQLPSTRLAAGI